MFHTKSKKEQFQDSLHDSTASLANSAAVVADQLRERVVPAVGHAAGSAKGWAKPRVEHGIEVAAPKLESAVSGLAPKVDTARDKIVEELLPRLTEAIAAFAAATTAAKNEAVSRGTGAAAVISGEAVAAPKCRKKRRVMLILGLLGAAGAGVAAFMKRSAPKDDPWATPVADPYVAPASARGGFGVVDGDAAEGAFAEGDLAAATGAADAESELTASPNGSGGTDETSAQDSIPDADVTEKDDTNESPRKK